jgi:hypothetical protein
LQDQKNYFHKFNQEDAMLIHFRRQFIIPCLLMAGMIALALLASPFNAGKSQAAESAPNSQKHDSKTPLDDPVVVVNEDATFFTISDGLLYWSFICSSDVVPTAYLHRKPTEGGETLAIDTGSYPLCDRFYFLAANESGLYDINLETNQLEFRPTEDPTADPIILQTLADNELPRPGGQILLDETDLYWLTENNRIVRLDKANTWLAEYAYTGPGSDDLAIGWGSIYWLDDLGLWEAPKYCSPLPCPYKTKLTDANGTGLQYGFMRYPVPPDKAADPYYYLLYWVEQGSPRSLRAYGCYDFGSCFTHTLYTASSADYRLSRPALGSCADGSGCLFWKEKDSSEAGWIMRKSLTSDAQVIATGLLHALDQVLTDDRGVYFQLLYNSGIARVDFDAAAYQVDFHLSAWEVTQGIQNPLNDVSLAGGKDTYVRVWAQLLCCSPYGNLSVRLYGERNGQPLPGSPLSPLVINRVLVEGAGYDRGNPDEGWLFHLPESWVTHGTTDLRAEIDPLSAKVDPNPANDVLTGSFDFKAQPRACTIFIPVRTQTDSLPWNDAPYFWNMIDLYKRLSPVPEVNVYTQSEPFEELEVCWWGPFPYPCFGPYELDEEAHLLPPSLADRDKLMASITTRYMFSDDPDECTSEAVHYVGMVSPDAPTGGAGGQGFLYAPAAWVTLPEPYYNPSTAFYWPPEGHGLAHQLTHNYNRLHVPCEVDVWLDNDYPPVDDCTLDDPGADSHYGFDVNTRLPIPPDSTSDYMSYRGRCWASDYTYSAVFDAMNPWLSQQSSVMQAALPLAQAANIVWASGFVDHDGQFGALEYAWLLPAGSLSAGQLHKLEAVSTPAKDVDAAAAGYSLRLLDANGVVLDERDLTLYEIGEGDGSGNSGLSFNLAFPAPAGDVHRLELLTGDTVLASLEPGPADPQLTLLAPAGGEISGGDLVVSWQASDPDPNDQLRYSVLFSPDNGLTWQALVSNISGPIGETTITQPVENLTGSGGQNALLRILASDGYHTTQVTSLPFEVQNQAPQPYIVSPSEGQSFAADEPVRLSGGAMDAETGSLAGDSLAWSLDGSSIGSGGELLLLGLAPGSYPVGLSAQDPAGLNATAGATVNINYLEIPPGGVVPVLDGFCDDQAYASAVQLSLAPYADGSQVSVQLLGSNGRLWACFSGLKHSAYYPYSGSGLRFDVDNSRDPLAQSTDFAFFVDESGTPITLSGDGAGHFTGEGPGGLQARVSATDELWAAEMAIDMSVLGGWDHLAGVALDHTNLNQAERYAWPYAASTGQPSTWAETALGTRPAVTSLEPDHALAGSVALELTVHGTDFVEGSVVLWDGGLPLATTWISPTQLVAQVPASELAAVGEFDLLVQNPAPSDFVSDGSLFPVENPRPVLLSASLERGGSGGLLIVTGQDFVYGAVVLWNGEARPTHFISSTELQVDLAAADLAYGRTVGVSVVNPGPGGGVATLQISTLQFGLYLPYIRR